VLVGAVVVGPVKLLCRWMRRGLAATTFVEVIVRDPLMGLESRGITVCGADFAVILFM
jgi:hypothetical protein